MINRLFKYLPGDVIDWQLIECEIFRPFVLDLSNTYQESKWHGEGDVYTHTKMVCEELIKLDEYRDLSDTEKLIVFLGCLFHDVGKKVTTKDLFGEITSFHHGPVGSVIVREYLWKEWNLAGEKEYQEFREAICLLVKYHSVPVYFDDSVSKSIIRLSLNSSLSRFFSLKLLCILAKADTLGRISSDDNDHLENIELFKEEACLLGCYEMSFMFSDGYTKYQYLNSDNVWEYQSLFDNSYGFVNIVCGLPGTGKDTYIKNVFPNLDVISLDDIRDEFNISPLDNQSKVYEIAKNRAKELLRNKKEFVWNATNLTNMIRNKQIKLFHDYNASVRIIFLETDLKTNFYRNNNRIKCVDEKVIFKMLSGINMPENSEAEEVVWEVV